MKTYTVVLESTYYGCDEEYQFGMPDDATREEIEQEGLKVLHENLQWYIKELDE